MPYPQRLLGAHEVVPLEMRPHWRTLHEEEDAWRRAGRDGDLGNDAPGGAPAAGGPPQ